MGSEDTPYLKGFAMNITVIIPSVTVEKLKQSARRIKKKLGLSHHEALDKVAEMAGFNHWHHVIQMAAKTEPVETAFRSGLVYGFDASEADFEAEFLEEIASSVAEYFAKDSLWQFYKNVDAADDPELANMSDEEFKEFLEEELQGLVFFRFTGNELPQTVDGAIELIREFSFWNPAYVWLNGTLHSTFYAPMTDRDGNVVGVRF